MVSTLIPYWPGNQDLRQQRSELHLAPGAAPLHVAENALEIAHADGERLHLAQSLVHLVQPVGHLLERLAEPFVERGLQLLVDGRPHLVQLLRILGAQDVEPLLDRRTHRLEALLVRSRELGEPVAQLRARSLGGGRLLAARVGDVLPQIALEIRRGLLQHFEPRADVRRLPRRGFARDRRASDPHEYGNHQPDNDGERDNDEQGHDVRHGAPSLLRSTQRALRTLAEASRHGAASEPRAAAYPVRPAHDSQGYRRFAARRKARAIAVSSLAPRRSAPAQSVKPLRGSLSCARVL